jgi:hypothetical protein
MVPYGLHAQTVFHRQLHERLLPVNIFFNQLPVIQYGSFKELFPTVLAFIQLPVPIFTIFDYVRRFAVKAYFLP